MSAQRDSGGPAFPILGQTDVRGETIWAESGMTLRDYFAAKALTGILSGGERMPTPPIAARLAYEYADAVLAERNKP